MKRMLIVGLGLLMCGQNYAMQENADEQGAQEMQTLSVDSATSEVESNNPSASPAEDLPAKRTMPTWEKRLMASFIGVGLAFTYAQKQKLKPQNRYLVMVSAGLIGALSGEPGKLRDLLGKIKPAVPALLSFQTATKS